MTAGSTNAEALPDPGGAGAGTDGKTLPGPAGAGTDGERPPGPAGAGTDGETLPGPAGAGAGTDGTAAGTDAGAPGRAAGAAAARRPRRAPAGASRQRDAERSRQALLAAALDEFSVRGYAGTRVADIARRAGVNKQLINYYFGSKEGLYLALQRSWLDREESFAPPDLPLADLVVRYLTDSLDDPRSLRLLLWRGLADDSAPDAGRGRQGDVDGVTRRQGSGEVAGDLDPAAVLLAGMGMVAAPVAMPQVARELFGVDPSSAEFRECYTEQLRRIVAHLAGDTPRGARDTPAGNAKTGGDGDSPGAA
ncbi:MAG TPA: TetR/AcrR family transcriptional regulator [Streptosporangiaceae bacterium]